MTDFVKAYYDANGMLRKYVIVVNEANYDHTVHDEKGLTGIILDKKVADALPAALNISGVAIHHHLNKTVVAQITQSDPVLGAKIQSNIDALDIQLSADAQKVVADQAAAVAAWNALSPAQQATALAAEDAMATL